MSSSDGQPPLTRRQVRDLERAREAGAAVAAATGSVPLPPASVTSPAAPTSISVPASAPRPSSSQGPSSPAPSSSQGPASGTSPAPVPSSVSTPRDEVAAAPTSFSAPGSVSDPGRTLTRRELRALRDAETTRSAEPVPLQAPAPEPRRDLSEALQGVDRMVAPLDGETAGSPSADVAEHDRPVVASGAVSSPPAPRESNDGTPRSVVPDTADDESVLPLADDDVTASTGPRRTGTPDTGPRGSMSPSTGSRPSSTPSVFPFDLSSSAASSTAPTTPSGRPVSVPAPADLSTGEPPRPTPAVHSPSAPVESVDSAAVSSASPSAAPVPPNPALSVPASVPNPSGYVPPVGHWSTQADEPDDDTVGGRTLGTSTGQHNALILTDQQVADVTGALNATGEIIITGSIDLPRSLGATGSQARIDNSDIDRLMEQGDAEQADTDAEPVRASRAISTHTSTRAVVLAAAQPKTHRLPLILGIGGGVIGAAIIGGIIAGFATGVL
ncbi:hypothetical protein ACPEEZ_05180 [Frigoribacterium sp. 2-23]|uniref:hypothetical protein n=1 Tax=Frigoribacterium sp. 2-23 TaxID=3415006 RepID=UPI003C6ECEF0